MKPLRPTGELLIRLHLLILLYYFITNMLKSQGICVKLLTFYKIYSMIMFVIKKKLYFSPSLLGKGYKLIFIFLLLILFIFEE